MRAESNLYGVLVVLVTVVVAVSAQANEEIPALPPMVESLKLEPRLVPYLNRTKLTVCTTPWTPAVTCSPDTDHTTWTGFEIEVFRLSTTRMGITDDMLEWLCYDDKKELLDDLYANKCDIAAAGMAPTTDRIAKGLWFSVPSIRTGFSIMVSRKEQPPGMWYFFSAMQWEVWLLMIGTGVVVGGIVWLFEVGMRSLNSDTHRMSRLMWDTMGRPVQMTDYRLSSFPANFTGILWSFCVFILMAMYSANLTANLTINQFKTDVKGLADLPGKAVGSWYGYQDELLKYNIATMGLNWNGPADEIAMIDKLKSGVITALVFDSNVLEIYDATDCDTLLVGDQFDMRDQCVAFSPALFRNYSDFTDAFDVSMLSVVQGTGGVEELIDKFIKVAPAECKTNDFSNGYSQVTLYQVSGLWVILSASILFGALVILGYRSWQRIGPALRKKGWFKGTDTVAKSFKSLKKAGFPSGKYPLDGVGVDHGDVYYYNNNNNTRNSLGSISESGMYKSNSEINSRGGGGGGGGGGISTTTTMNTSSMNYSRQSTMVANGTNGRGVMDHEIPIITMDGAENGEGDVNGVNTLNSNGSNGNGDRVRSGGRVSFVVGDIEAPK